MIYSSCEWIRNLKCWKYAIDYFPVDLVKTVDLPPNRNYLFAACPHAIVTFVSPKKYIKSVSHRISSMKYSFYSFFRIALVYL